MQEVIEMKMAREKKEIKVFELRDPYIIANFLPEILEKYSSWLRGVHLDFRGPSDVMDVLMKNEYKKNSIIMSGSSYWAMAYNAVPPHKKPYIHYAIAQQFTASIGLVTLDPNIRSWSDLQGKTVNMYLPGSIVNEVFTTVLKLHGIYNEVNKVYVYYPQGRDGLLDGSIDATETCFYKGPGVLGAHDTLVDLISRRSGEVHFITFTKEEIEEIAKKSAFPIIVMKIRAEEIQKKFQLKQQKDLSWVTIFHWLGCDKEMDPEITYEICRVMNENLSEYGIKYHAPAYGWTQKKLAKEVLYSYGGLANCGVKREFFHHGALKYYDEHGIKAVEPPLPGKVALLKES
jgi:TRAP-type uncharacterized transport system substrate-binding protein